MSAKIYNFKKKFGDKKSLNFIPPLKEDKNPLVEKMKKTDFIKNIKTSSEKPITGDFIIINETLYPGYKTKIFKVVGHMDAGVYQICIKPLSEKDKPIGIVWVMYDEINHKKITDSTYLEILSELF